MENEEYPPRPVAPDKTQSSCIRAAGMTCLVVAVIGLIVGFWIFRTLTRNPVFQKAYQGAMQRKQCEQNLTEIGGALQRYANRNGAYPDSPAKLYPNFIEKSELLHCPADPTDKAVSYEYAPPAMNAPPTTIVAACRRHKILEDHPPIGLFLLKDGRVISEDKSERENPLGTNGEE